MDRAPVTEVDGRFSDPGAQATSWAQARNVLESAELFWITTVRVGGRPHVTPLVGVWFNDVLYFCTGLDEQKGVNLANNPQVALTTGCNSWEEGLDVVVEGDAVRVTDDALLRALAKAWAQKWDGRWTFEARDGAFHHHDGGEAFVFGVAPSKVLSFGKGIFSHTRHLFLTPPG